MPTKDLSACIAVIPALAPEEALADYAACLLERGFGQVLVVDDGSGPDYAGVFRELEALAGCTVLRHGENRGKGRALKTAFAYILGRPDWTGRAVVTADADGQHRPEDVCAVGLAALKEERGIVLGVRDLTGPEVPPKSRVGNRLSSWGFRALYGPRLPDTQTGLRGFPYGLLGWCAAIGGERYEYEMNVLIQAARERLELRQIPIAAVYFDNNRGTHLRALRDSWRVFAILISGLGWYAASAVLSAAADVAAFTVCDLWVFARLPEAACYWWSTMTARLLSSMLNYTLNRRYVFSARARGRAVVRYYILWLCQLGASYLLLLGLSALLPWLHDTVNKAVGDILLAICSYQIQMHWVFREETLPE